MQGPSPCLGLGAGTLRLSCPGHQPLFFGSCSQRSGHTQNPLFSLFLPVRPAGALGINQPPRISLGTSSPAAAPAGVSQGHPTPAGPYRQRCLQAAAQCAWDGGLSAREAPTAGASPQLGEATNQHKSAQRRDPPTIFLPPARGGPSASPGASPRQPHVLPLTPFSMPPSPGTASRFAGGTYLHALCVFLSERRGGR